MAHNITNISNPIPIHNGINTNHHDQVITFNNFNTTKITSNTSKRPSPTVLVSFFILFPHI